MENVHFQLSQQLLKLQLSVRCTSLHYVIYKVPQCDKMMLSIRIQSQLKVAGKWSGWKGFFAVHPTGSLQWLQMAVFRSLIYWSFVKVYTNDSVDQIRKSFLLSNFFITNLSLAPLSFQPNILFHSHHSCFLHCSPRFVSLSFQDQYLSSLKKPAQPAVSTKSFLIPLFCFIYQSLCCLNELFQNIAIPNFMFSILKYSSYVRKHREHHQTTHQAE